MPQSMLLLLVALGSLPTILATSCQADNCLREIRGNVGGAAFCSSYLGPGYVATSVLPTFVASCSATPSRLSSACSCLTITTLQTVATPTPPITVTEIITETLPPVISTFDVTSTTTAVEVNTETDTATVTEVDTATETDTATATETDTATFTEIDTATATETDTVTNTETDTATVTNTATEIDTTTATATETDVTTATATTTEVEISTATATETDTATKTNTATSTSTQTATVTSVTVSVVTHTSTTTATTTATVTKTFTSLYTNSPNCIYFGNGATGTEHILSSSDSNDQAIADCEALCNTGSCAFMTVAHSYGGTAWFCYTYPIGQTFDPSMLYCTSAYETPFSAGYSLDHGRVWEYDVAAFGSITMTEERFNASVSFVHHGLKRTNISV